MQEAHVACSEEVVLSLLLDDGVAAALALALAAASRRSFSSCADVHFLHFSVEPVLRWRSSAYLERKEDGQCCETITVSGMCSAVMRLHLEHGHYLESKLWHHEDKDGVTAISFSFISVLHTFLENSDPTRRFRLHMEQSKIPAHLSVVTGVDMVRVFFY